MGNVSASDEPVHNEMHQMQKKDGSHFVYVPGEFRDISKWNTEEAKKEPESEKAC